MESDLIAQTRRKLRRRRVVSMLLIGWAALSILTVASALGLLLGARAAGVMGAAPSRTALILAGAGTLGLFAACLTTLGAILAGVIGPNASAARGVLDGVHVGMTPFEWVLSVGMVVAGVGGLVWTLVLLGPAWMWAGGLVCTAAGSPALLLHATRRAVEDALNAGDIRKAKGRLQQLRPLLSTQARLQLQARLALLTGDLAAAEAAARRGTQAGLPRWRLATLTRVAVQREDYAAASDLLAVWYEVDIADAEPHMLDALVELLGGVASETTVERLRLAEELASRRMGRPALLAPVLAARAWAHAVQHEPEDARRDLVASQSRPCRVPEWVAERDLALARARQQLEPDPAVPVMGAHGPWRTRPA